jgi:hypothetical protein
MVPDMVPASLLTLLQAFAPLFTAPSFRTFTGLACGFLAQGGKSSTATSTGAPAGTSSDTTSRAAANWVVAGIVVRLPFTSRPVTVPVMAKLVIKGTNSKSRLWLATWMAGRLAAALPGREVRVVADSAYAGGELKHLPPAYPGRPGCGRTPPCTACRRSGPAGPAGPG